MRHLLLLPALAVVAALPRDTDTVYTTHTDKCKPEQIHIAFGDKVNDITVTWSTFQETKDTLLQYGEKKLDKTVKGEQKLFVDGGPLKWSQWIHNVRLKDLKFSTSYVYKVGSACGWSKQFAFKTPASGEDGPVNIVILGDMGVSKDFSREFIEADVKTGKYDFVIHVGDFAYDFRDEDGKRGDTFMNGIQETAANYPYMVCPGNHEHHFNYSHYKTRFSMPGNFKNMFYSYDIGPIHFVSINTEAYYNNTEYPGLIPNNNVQMATQYHWLENDLKEANKPENRQKHPWIIIYGHRPFYCSMLGNGCGSDFYHQVGIPRLGGYALEPLLYKYTVDLEIWGHMHAYERMWPVYNKKVYNGSYEQPYLNPRAPVQFTTGGAGCWEKTAEFVKPDPWTAASSRDFGYTRFTAHNKTHLYVEQVAVHNPVKSRNLEGAPKKVDEFWIIKHHRNSYDSY